MAEVQNTSGQTFDKLVVRMTFTEPSGGYLMFDFAQLLLSTNRVFELGSLVDSYISDPDAIPRQMHAGTRFRSLAGLHRLHYSSDPVVEVAFRGLETSGLIAAVIGAIRGALYLFDLFQNVRYRTVETSVKIRLLRTIVAENEDAPEHEKYLDLERAVRVLWSLHAIEPAEDTAGYISLGSNNPLAERAIELQNDQRRELGDGPLSL